MVFAWGQSTRGGPTRASLAGAAVAQLRIRHNSAPSAERRRYTRVPTPNRPVHDLGAGRVLVRRLPLGYVVNRRSASR